MIGNSNTIRSFIVGFLIIGFLVTASVFFILLSQGTRITPNGNIVQTSVIRINSVPKNVRAYINDEEVNINDNLIQNIELGEVTLTLEQEGFTSWSKTLNIEEGKVKDVFAQLFPETLENAQISTEPIDQLVYADDLSHIYFSVLNSEIPTNNGLWKYRLSSGVLDLSNNPEPVQFFQFTDEFYTNLSTNRYSLELSNDKDTILLDIPSTKELYTIQTGNGEIDDIFELLGYYPDFITWFRGSDSLLIAVEGVLFEMTIDGVERSIVSFNNDETLEFCISDKTVYSINTNINTIELYNTNKSEQIDLLLDSDIIIDNDTKLYCTNTDNILIVSTNEGIFYIQLDEIEIVKVDVPGEVITVQRDGEAFLYEVDDEIFAATLDHTAQTTKLDLTKTSIPPSTDTNSIFYSANNKIIISAGGLEVRDIDSLNPIQILEDLIIDTTTIQISENGEELFAVVINSTDLESTATVRNIYKFELDK